MEEKLQKFSQSIFAKATKEKEDIVRRAEYAKENCIKEKELMYLEKAYTHIQESIRDIDREKEEMVSKAHMEQKKVLLECRENINKEVYDIAKSKLKEYTLTDAYKDSFMEDLHKDMSLMGDGDIQITINSADESFAKDCADKYGAQVKIYDGQEDIIGGWIIENKSNRRYVDHTLLEKLNDRFSKFNSISRLRIDE